MRAILYALVSALVLACGKSPACVEDRRVVGVEWASPFRASQEGFVTEYRRRGYDCRDDGVIRNGAGQSVGTRYVCTRCS
jgi:hypothetical protein